VQDESAALLNEEEKDAWDGDVDSDEEDKECRQMLYHARIAMLELVGERERVEAQMYLKDRRSEKPKERKARRQKVLKEYLSYDEKFFRPQIRPHDIPQTSPLIADVVLSLVPNRSQL
jgi:hypothetical protein